MNLLKKRLVCLNLALLLLILTAVPAGAVSAPQGTGAAAEAGVSAGAETPAEPEASGGLAASNGYRLHLFATGGRLPGGATMTSLNSYAGYFNLSGYLCGKSGYAHVGWKTHATSTSLIPLNELYRPRASSSSLYAYWVQTGSDYVILNALQGSFQDGDLWKTTRSVLPEAEDIRHTGGPLLGWSSELSPASDSSYDKTFSGSWYTGSVTPGGATPQVLYAQYAQPKGQYVVYHFTKGRAQSGGNTIVQGGVPATGTSLTLIPVNQSEVAGPADWEFRGWASSPLAEMAEYTGDIYERIPPQTGITHLYSVWRRKETQIAPYLYLSVDADGKTVTVRGDRSDLFGSNYDPAHRRHTAAMALYDSDGKMLDCTVQSYRNDGFMTLRLHYSGALPSQCRLFAWDQYGPGRPALRFRLADYV